MFALHAVIDGDDMRLRLAAPAIAAPELPGRGSLGVFPFKNRPPPSLFFARDQRHEILARHVGKLRRLLPERRDVESAGG